MSQSGFTPISNYSSATASAVPLAANLVQGELAINTADGKLFYKDSAGVVQTMASKATGAIGGSNTQVQFNNSGVLGGSANLTFDGTTLTANALTTTSTVTINGGTANGVAYLNGSKVLTTGSALTFDGSNFKLTGSDNNNPVWSVNSNAGNQAIRIQANVAGLYLQGSGTVDPLYITQSSATGYISFRPASDTEQMRLTSTGLGIGTSSPSKKLDVSSSTQRGQIAMSGSNVVAIRWASTDPNPGERNWEITNNIDSQGALSFRTGATQAADPTTTRMIIDSSGNLGLGVTPSASLQSARRVLQVGGNGALWGQSSGAGTLFLSNNTYYDGTNFRYLNTSGAGYYAQLTDGSHSWNQAASGTAGNAITFTQALTLDSSGRLLVGLTSATSTNANIQTNKPINLAGYTVATLPSGTLGDMAYVTDALAPTFLGTIVGGGTIKTPVFYNGTNWVAH